MNPELFAEFAPLLRDLTDAQLGAELETPKKLLIDTAWAGGKRLEVAYAPFDYVNPHARIVIVGLTPGRQQMRNAALEARRLLRAGGAAENAARAAKTFASFSGPMRANLIAMLDEIGVNRLLGLTSTASLWDIDAGLVHFTSALRYPVFVDGANYSGAPDMLSTPLLRQQLQKWFAAEVGALRSALFVPLGPKVTAAVSAVASWCSLDSRQVIAGLPHPSGANSERIAFFLGRKRREDLSSKVEPHRLLESRRALDMQIKALAGTF